MECTSELQPTLPSKREEGRIGNSKKKEKKNQTQQQTETEYVCMEYKTSEITKELLTEM